MNVYHNCIMSLLYGLLKKGKSKMRIVKKVAGELCMTDDTATTRGHVAGIYFKEKLYISGINTLEETIALEKYKADLRKRRKKYQVVADIADFGIALIDINDAEYEHLTKNK